MHAYDTAVIPCVAMALPQLDAGGLEQLVGGLEAVFHQPGPAISDGERWGHADV